MPIINSDFSTINLTKNDSLSGDEKYMLRCLEIAKNGLGQTAPNPMVGSLIIHNNKIIGEGYTSAFGGAHAEVNAIASVKDTSLLKLSTLYVSLEPCSHFGKTPPCADLIIKHKIPKVVIGLVDPHDKVAGKGIAKLKEAGCIVKTGILEKACKEHHKRFLTSITKKRPYIILKWAETANGFIAPADKHRGNTKEPYWITNSVSRQLVHKWRSEESAILVGTTTALADNPKLNLRDWEGKPPMRIVIDRSLKIPASYHILNGEQPTMVITETEKPTTYIKGLQYRLIDFAKNVPQQICKLLQEENIQSLLVEGGTKTLQSFIETNLWDEARIFKGNRRFESGIAAPTILGPEIGYTQLKEDQLTILKND